MHYLSRHLTWRTVKNFWEINASTYLIFSIVVCLFLSFSKQSLKSRHILKIHVLWLRINVIQFVWGFTAPVQQPSFLLVLPSYASAPFRMSFEQYHVLCVYEVLFLMRAFWTIKQFTTTLVVAPLTEYPLLDVSQDEQKQHKALHLLGKFPRRHQKVTTINLIFQAQPKRTTEEKSRSGPSRRVKSRTNSKTINDSGIEFAWRRRGIFFSYKRAFFLTLRLVCLASVSCFTGTSWNVIKSVICVVCFFEHQEMQTWSSKVVRM